MDEERLNFWDMIKLGIIWCLSAFAEWVAKKLYPNLHEEYKRLNEEKSE